jgi:hypothetical protein
MLGVLGLITGWLLLMPLLALIYVKLGGPYLPILDPFAHIALSVPMLGFCTIGGIALVVWSVRRLARGNEDPFG